MIVDITEGLHAAGNLCHSIVTEGIEAFGYRPSVFNAFFVVIVHLSLFFPPTVLTQYCILWISRRLHYAHYLQNYVLEVNKKLIYFSFI